MKKRLKDRIGERVTKLCPDCGLPMVIRQNSNTLDFFLGCSDYPNCTGTAKIPESWYMEEMGQARLFPPSDIRN